MSGLKRDFSTGTRSPTNTIHWYIDNTDNHERWRVTDTASREREREKTEKRQSFCLQKHTLYLYPVKGFNTSRSTNPLVCEIHNTPEKTSTKDSSLPALALASQVLCKKIKHKHMLVFSFYLVPTPHSVIFYPLIYYLCFPYSPVSSQF